MKTINGTPPSASRTWVDIPHGFGDDVITLEDGFYTMYMSSGTDTLILDYDSTDVTFQSSSVSLTVKH